MFCVPLQFKGGWRSCISTDWTLPSDDITLPLTPHQTVRVPSQTMPMDVLPATVSFSLSVFALFQLSSPSLFSSSFSVFLFAFPSWIPPSKSCYSTADGFFFLSIYVKIHFRRLICAVTGSSYALTQNSSFEIKLSKKILQSFSLHLFVKVLRHRVLRHTY
jgi:hypothetical protein